jgi:uncharacterized membrane protein
MAAVLLALAASASWGVSDFLGGLKARSVSVLTVLGVSQPATTKGLLSVVAVLAALYPVLVAILARVVLGERLTAVQRGGALVAIGGAAAISAG